MKFIVAILLTAFLAYVVCLYLPWWGFAVTSLIVALAIHQFAYRAFLSGFLGLFLFWGTYAWVTDSANAHILSQKIAQILPLGGSYILLIFITATVGGLVSGFAALTGCYVRKKQKTF